MAPSALGRSAAGHRLSYSAAWPLAGHEEGAGGDGAGAADAATPALALSTDFSLLPEIRKIYRYELSARERIQLQLRRWRRHPIFGIVENKLLCGSMLASLIAERGIPKVRQAPIIYGAFATKRLGRWPRYERDALEGALRGRRDFVLKSATNGGGADVLIMTAARWEREGWRLSNVSDYAERFLRNRWFSEWGQQYEHRAVVVQENVAAAAASVRTSGRTAAPGLTFEIKANVAFGRLGTARLFVLPKADSVHLELSFCEAGRLTCSGTRCVGGARVCADYCRRAVSMLSSVAPSLESLVHHLTSTLAADWLRIDTFVTERDGEGGLVDLVINEISYPSHLERNASVCCSFERLLSVYRRRAFRLVNGSDVQTRAMELAGLSEAHAAAFLTEPDYFTLQHARDSVYDSQLWQWNPTNPHKYEHRSNAGRAALSARASARGGAMKGGANRTVAGKGGSSSSPKSRGRAWPAPILWPSGCAAGVADHIRTYDECRAAAGAAEINATGIHHRTTGMNKRFQSGCSRCGDGCSSRDVGRLFFNAFSDEGSPSLNPKHTSVCRSPGRRQHANL